MILGIGIDICDIERVNKTLKNYGERFKKRCFTIKERSKCDKVKNSVACYAKRFSAKESVSKALGTGMKKGVNWKNIEIVNMKSGKPTVILYGKALDVLKKMLPKNMRVHISISITDEKGLAQSLVIIEANKEEVF